MNCLVETQLGDCLSRIKKNLCKLQFFWPKLPISGEKKIPAHYLAKEQKTTTLKYGDSRIMLWNIFLEQNWML